MIRVHLPVRVPPKPEGGISDAELVRRYRILYPKPTAFVTTQAGVPEEILETGGPAAAQLRAKLMRQMYDLGALMKLLKQPFSTWFNRSHRRFGTQWATRDSNTSVEGCPMAIRTVAAYIDLNPVRAGLVDDPARLSGTACRERGTPVCRVKPYQTSRLREAVPGRVGGERVGDPRSRMWIARAQGALVCAGVPREAAPSLTPA